eukprot:CAMPEP_0172599974 /NCGR_PEP_ID=MMETSP1068-20121228/20103_1 /TAXON_ID=35684 /ORGANISM="Pseudopedinella elastica, Strain CCMP716" /LENGTH=428 /DNA_ID=CAMNT_0013400409 /DNA_START=210 /DNA_END=1496 /DNA_ORIENTATION=-
MADMVQLSTAYNAGITCHAFNGDGSKIAICPNNNELHIFGRGASGWTLEHRLTEHDMVISGVDWCGATNSIVTCSHDRNAFVWSEVNQADGGVSWKPSLVILRIDKSALGVRWSPSGAKFAVASAAKCVSVCSFADEDNWWVSKMIKKHKSAVLCVAWHPNSQFLATGSTDFKCRVFSAYISGPEGKPDPAQPADLLGKVEPFGECYHEFPSNSAANSGAVGWVTAVAWAPSGSVLAFAAHDSSLGVVTFPPASQGVGGEGSRLGANPPVEQLIRFGELPLNSLAFVSEVGLVGAGHGCAPVAFARSKDGGQACSDDWALVGLLEEDKGGGEGDKGAAKQTMAASARALFQQMSLGSESGGGSTPRSNKPARASSSWKQHQSPVTCLTTAAAAPGSKSFPAVATTAMDGRLVVWDLRKTPVPASVLGV